jgi:replicative DNA helicase
MSKRHVLASHAAEEALIGALLSSRRDAFSAVDSELKHTDFYSTHLGAAFQALGSLNARGLTISVPAVIGASLETTMVALDPQKLEIVVAKNSEYLTDADIMAHCETVKGFSVRRRIKAACDAAIANAHADGTSPLAIVDELQRKLADTNNSAAYDPQDARDVAFDVLANARRMAESGGFPGVRTGFRELDRAILGFCAGDMIVVAARPGMGKSSLLKDFSQNVAKGDYGAAVFGLEMPNVQTIGRQIASESGIGYRQIRTGQMSPEQWDKFADTVDSFAPGNLFMDDRVGGISDIRQRSRRIRAKLERSGKKLAFVGVDYLQLIPGTKESRQESISDVSRGLKLLAMELGCTVVALSQLNRNLEQREDKRPMLSDLRDSGAIEQDADIVLFPFREHEYDKGVDPGQAELIVAKNRNGDKGTIWLKWHPETMRFTDAVTKGDSHG